MSIDESLIDPRMRPFVTLMPGVPAALVDLNGLPYEAEIKRNFPVHLIGIGGTEHPIAPQMDCLIEAPVSLDAILGAMQNNPHAAATLMDVLSSADGMGVSAALTVESLAYGLLQGSAEYAAWLAGRSDASGAGNGRVLAARVGDELRIVLDRPAAHNAINTTMRDGLCAAFEVAVADSSITRIEMEAIGPAFSIGGDLAEFGTTTDPAEAHMIRMRSLPARLASEIAPRLHVHVQGACVGAGIEIAAFASRLTASASAWFQLPELSMGLIPGAGGCVSVPRRIGRQRAALMMLSGRRINARTALSWGLIDAIEDRPAVDPGAEDFHPI